MAEAVFRSAVKKLDGSSKPSFMPRNTKSWDKDFNDKYDPKNKDKYFASALFYAFNDDKKTYKRIYDSIINLNNKKSKKEYQFNKEKSKVALEIYGKPKLFQGYLIGGIAATFHVFAIIPLFCGFWIVNYALTAITLKSLFSVLHVYNQ